VGGACGEVAILPAHSPSFTLPRGHEALTCTTVLPRFLFGGFDRGKEVGTLIYRLNGVEIGRIPLLTATACAREEPLSLWTRIKRIFIK
jgi:hypothetical protein